MIIFFYYMIVFNPTKFIPLIYSINLIYISLVCKQTKQLLTQMQSIGVFEEKILLLLIQ